MISLVNVLTVMVLLAVIGSVTADVSNSYSQTDSNFGDDENGNGDDENGNRLYSEVEINDEDEDGVLDDQDNCPDVPNEDQLDTDGDGDGDACDESPNGDDEDGDGVLDDQDNCPDVPNEDQLDTDGNGVGDECDTTLGGTDEDGDGVLDDQDNCPDVPNEDQLDTDGNGVGDECDITTATLNIGDDREMTIEKDETATIEFNTSIRLCDDEPNTGKTLVEGNTVKYTPAADTKIVTFTVCPDWDPVG
jgi:hypothetical protein